MKNHFLARLFALLLCFTLLCAVCVPAFADLGDFAGDNDYGGGGGWDDGGGGGGWDWGGGGGGGYDYDWGDSSGSSSRSSGGGDVSVGVLVAVVVVMIVIFLIRAAASSSDDGDSSGYEDSHEYRYHGGDDYNSNYNRTINTARSYAESEPTPEEYRNLKPIDRYSSIDPSFSAAKLKQKLSNLYIQMQQCWQAKDLDSLRPYFTDAYFSQLDRQLDDYRRKGITNYVERPVVLSVRFDGFCQEGGEDHIYATVRTRIVDYKLDDETGRLVSGSRSREKFMTYRWHLTRPTGLHSESEGGVRSVSCPNCGAPLSINESAKCPFCGSVVTADACDFVIAQIEGVAQRTE